MFQLKNISSFNICYAVLFIAAVFAQGCSGYIEKDFPSEGVFYKEYNSIAGNHSIVIGMRDSSIFRYSQGSYLSCDSLFLLRYYKRPVNSVLPLKKIASIEYTNPLSRFGQADFLSVGGRFYHADSFKISNDSLYFSGEFYRPKAIDLKSIREISINNKLYGSSLGFSAGAALDIVLWSKLLYNFGLFNINLHRGQRLHPVFVNLIYLPAVGAVLGYIFGYHYNFFFR